MEHYSARLGVNISPKVRYCYKCMSYDFHDSIIAVCFVFFFRSYSILRFDLLCIRYSCEKFLLFTQTIWLINSTSMIYRSNNIAIHPQHILYAVNPVANFRELTHSFTTKLKGKYSSLRSLSAFVSMESMGVKECCISWPRCWLFAHYHVSLLSLRRLLVTKSPERVGAHHCYNSFTK